MSDRTQVAIVGAGPAGLLLGHLLHRAGIETVVLEQRSRAHVEARVRAGVLEQATVDVLVEAGVGERLRREGAVHEGVVLQLDGERHRIDLAGLTGGRTITVYGQQEVVKDLVAARLDAGLALDFEVSDVGVAGFDGDEPVVTYVDASGASRSLRCDAIAGCDGFHGVCRAAVEDRMTLHAREFPFAWLGILARVAPSAREIVYALQGDGFALASMRSSELTRLYVQVERDAALAAWPDRRVWDALHERLAMPGWSLAEGEVLERGLAPVRAFVAEPMRFGRLALAGDAVHIVPPTGAKGLNLAVADVTVLARALEDLLVRGSPAGLDAYSATCLAHVWRVQQFACRMTDLLHRPPGQDAFAARLQRAQLRHVVTSVAAATALAEQYVGMPHPT